MADNVTLPGAGEVIATDDVSGVQFQQMKLVDGALGSTTPAKVDALNRLEVSSRTQEVTATINAVNAAATTAELNDEMAYVFSMNGTPSGVTLAVEGSHNGSTWTGLACMLVLPNTGSNWTGTQSYANSVSWADQRQVTGHTAGYKYFRVRATGWSSGSGTIVLRMLKQPIVQMQTNGNLFVSQMTSANFNAQVVGNVGAGAADSGNPIKIGGIAVTGAESLVTNAQRANTRHDKTGRVVVQPYQHRERVIVQATTITASTTETTIVNAQGAGVFADLSALTITNSSATAVVVTIRSVSGNTPAFNYLVPAGGGVAQTFPVPWPQQTANQTWSAQCSGSVSSIYINAVLVLNQ